MEADHTDPERPADEPRLCRPWRAALCAFGWLNVGLGLLGMVLPVMPTTVFLLIALWAFSKSSIRFHRWLYTHPTLGRAIRAWHAHRVIPPRAKLLAVGMMTLSLAFVSLYVADGWLLPVGLGVVLASVATFIVSRPSHIPT